MKKLHERVKHQLKKKNQDTSKRVNKERKRNVLELRDWVWAYLRKERFLNKRNGKFIPR